jgi:tetratricopeptide (TPR) repeat protein
MAEDNETNSVKKRRIIHWNPDAGREQAQRRWTWKRILAWSVGGFFGLLVAAGLVIRGVKLVFGPDVFSPQTQVAAAEGPDINDANAVFVSQTKAEQSHQLASKTLAQLRRMPADHPALLQQMILMEKSFGEAEMLLARREYGRAFHALNALGAEMDAFTQNIKINSEAKQSYDAILLRIKDLEIARDLLPGALDSAFESAGQGRQLLTNGDFGGAKKLFEQGFTELKKAEQALADHVKDNLLRGQKALAVGDKEEATQAFQAALAKSPGNEAALQGLKRAENIDRVYALLQQGEKLEKEKQFAQAAESYEKAFALDKLSAAAQEGQSRASRLEKETRFARAKLAAEEAFKTKDWAKVIAESETALKVYPKKPEVESMLKSAKENAHKDAVQKALAKGYAFETQHQWKEARDAYSETMQLQPDHADAKEGYIRAGAVIRALLEYEKRIDAAEVLANKNEFQNARAQFNEAMAVKPDYLVTSERVQQLRSLIMAQSQPVDVTFKSDGRTYVQITNFKMLSQFDTMVVKIFPGDYEIVGRRKGYVDTRMMLQVRNGVPPPTVTVACNVADSRR